MAFQKSKLNSLLLITGSKRNIGKTSVACMLIKSFSQNNALTAIKVSSHFHEPTPGLEILEKNEDYILYKELNKDTGKDSSRMLRAGAKFAFYFEVNKGYLEKAFYLYLDKFDPGIPIVCESTSLSSIIDPGVRLNIISNMSGHAEKEVASKETTNQINLRYDLEMTSLPFNNISINNGNWFIKSINNPET